MGEVKMRSVVFVLEFIATVVMIKVFILLARNEISLTSLLAMGLILYGIYYFVLDLIDLFIYAKKKLSKSEREGRGEK